MYRTGVLKSVALAFGLICLYALAALAGQDFSGQGLAESARLNRGETVAKGNVALCTEMQKRSDCVNAAEAKVANNKMQKQKNGHDHLAGSGCREMATWDDAFQRYIDAHRQLPAGL